VLDGPPLASLLSLPTWPPWAETAPIAAWTWPGTRPKANQLRPPRGPTPQIAPAHPRSTWAGGEPRPSWPPTPPQPRPSSRAAWAQVQDVPVMSEEAYLRANATNQAVRVANREAAQRHRDEAARLRARGAELTRQVEADFFHAREAARIIDAGPGILRRKAAQVLTAQALRDEITKRWPTTSLPGSDWSDRLVGHCAANLAQAMVNDAARHHSDEAHRADQAAASYRQRLGVRQQNQLQGRLNASRRVETLALLKASELIWAPCASTARNTWPSWLPSRSSPSTRPVPGERRSWSRCSWPPTNAWRLPKSRIEAPAAQDPATLGHPGGTWDRNLDHSSPSLRVTPVSWCPQNRLSDGF